MVSLVPKPGSCIPSPCLQVLWVLECSALPILQPSNGQGPCWDSCCNKGTEGWVVLGGMLARVPAQTCQAWQSLGSLPLSGVANASLCSVVFTRLINQS